MIGFGINTVATLRCNRNCSYCKQNKQNIDITEEQLRIALRKVISIRGYPQFVTISGGEATLLGDKLIDLFNVVEEESFLSTRVLNTNGTASLDFYTSLKKCDVGVIIFSLDKNDDSPNKLRIINEIKKSGYFRVRANHVFKDSVALKRFLETCRDLDIMSAVMTNVHSEDRSSEFNLIKKEVIKILGQETQIRSEDESYCALVSPQGTRVIVKNGVFKGTMLFITPYGKLTEDFNGVLTGKFQNEKETCNS